MPSNKTKSKRPVVRRTSPTSCSPVPCPFCGNGGLVFAKQLKQRLGLSFAIVAYPTGQLSTM